MYESHFGFSGSPFQLNPDPAFYFGSRGHSNALAYLKFGAHQGEGFIVVTGEIGAGKTTLVRTLLEGLNPDQVVAAHVVNTQLESTELLQSILLAFGVASNRTSKAYLIATLEGFLTTLASKGRRALLIIDEAQNLRHEAVEELRMLSNFQLGKYGLLQSFLVGQPELRTLLQSKSMEQLRQRVIASCHLGPLDATESRAYVEHRLRVVGWKGISPQIAGDAFERVHHWTGGVPRKINRLCNRLLLGAFLAGTRVVTSEMVDETALELKGEIGEGISASASPVLEAGPSLAPAALPASAAAPRPEPSPADALALVPVSVAAPAPSVQSSEGHAAYGDRTPPRAPPSAPTWTPPAIQPAPVAPDLGARSPGHSLTAEARMASRSSSSQRVVRRVHQSQELSHPLICLVDSASDYLKAGILAEAFRGFPSLPRIVAVHAGVESDLGLADLDDMQMPLPAQGVHLGVSARGYASQTSKLVGAFDALLNEMDPGAIMVFGSSDADLACSLLANKRGIRLLRTGSGMRETHSTSNSAINAVLIEKIADVLYTDSTEFIYALYREGIRLDRIQSVGSLTGEVLGIARVRGNSSPALTGPSSRAAATRLPATYGLITVDPCTGFSESGSLSTAIELFCELSRELPLVWMVHPEGRRLIEYSNSARRIEASGITFVEPTGVRQSLAMLRGAKCLIARDEGAWLPEAKALAILTLVLTPRSSLESTRSAEGAVAPEVLAESNRTDFRDVLESPVSTSQPPEYWDGGTASRIASHLVGWFSKVTAVSSRNALTAPALVRS